MVLITSGNYVADVGISTQVAQSKIQECLTTFNEADYNRIMLLYKVRSLINAHWPSLLMHRPRSMPTMITLRLLCWFLFCAITSTPCKLSTPIMAASNPSRA